MTYFAYARTDDTLRLDYAGRVEERGIIGTVYDLPEPIAECETLDEAISATRVHLCPMLEYGYTCSEIEIGPSAYFADDKAIRFCEHRDTLCGL